MSGRKTGVGVINKREIHVAVQKSRFPVPWLDEMEKGHFFWG
jgi:hypothetical protein